MAYTLEEKRSRLEGLEAEYRNVRIKKQDMERGMVLLTNKRFTLLEKIQTIGVELRKLSRLQGKVTTQLNKSNNELSAKNRELAIVSKKVEQKLKEPTLAWEKVERLKLDNEEILSNIAKAEYTLEQKNRAFAKQQVEDKQKQAEFKKAKDAFGAQKDAYYKDMAKLAEDKKKTLAYNEEARSNLNKAKNIRIGLETKIAETEKEKVLFERKNDATEKKDRILDGKIRQYEELSAEFDERIKKSIEASERYDKAYKNIELEKREVRVKELRVAKIIRDKGLKKELEELEKSLKE